MYMYSAVQCYSRYDIYSLVNTRQRITIARLAQIQREDGLFSIVFPVCLPKMSGIKCWVSGSIYTANASAS